MKGAIVFLIVFAIALVITMDNTAIPPGKAIYDAALPNTEPASGYLVGGKIDAVTLIISVFNGVIYGFIAWLVFTLLMMVFKKDKKTEHTACLLYTSPSPRDRQRSRMPSSA